MSEILLIHGACFGAWCWERVIPALAERGLCARAIDLPGRGAVASLDDQARAIVAALRGPTLLVGHSAAGFAITAAAEISADVVGLIYVCGYVPLAGMSVAAMRRAGPSQPMAGAFEVSADRQLFGFKPERARQLFFHDCEDASARLGTQAILPMEQALAPALRQLPRGAVICAQDRAIPPEYQREMAVGMVQRELDLGHAPFLAGPGVLAAAIVALLGEITGPEMGVSHPQAPLAPPPWDI